MTVESLGTPNPTWHYSDVNSQGRLLGGSNSWEESCKVNDGYLYELVEVRSSIPWVSLTKSVQRCRRRGWGQTSEDLCMQKLLFCLHNILSANRTYLFILCYCTPTPRLVVWMWLLLTSCYLEWTCYRDLAKCIFFPIDTVIGSVMGIGPKSIQ